MACRIVRLTFKVSKTIGVFVSATATHTAHASGAAGGAARSTPSTLRSTIGLPVAAAAAVVYALGSSSRTPQVPATPDVSSPAPRYIEDALRAVDAGAKAATAAKRIEEEEVTKRWRELGIIAGVVTVSITAISAATLSKVFASKGSLTVYLEYDTEEAAKQLAEMWRTSSLTKLRQYVAAIAKGACEAHLAEETGFDITLMGVEALDAVPFGSDDMLVRCAAVM